MEICRSKTGTFVLTFIFLQTTIPMIVTLLHIMSMTMKRTMTITTNQWPRITIRENKIEISIGIHTYICIKKNRENYYVISNIFLFYFYSSNNQGNRGGQSPSINTNNKNSNSISEKSTGLWNNWQTRGKHSELKNKGGRGFSLHIPLNWGRTPFKIKTIKFF